MHLANVHDDDPLLNYIHHEMDRLTLENRTPRYLILGVEEYGRIMKALEGRRNQCISEDAKISYQGMELRRVDMLRCLAVSDTPPTWHASIINTFTREQIIRALANKDDVSVIHVESAKHLRQSLELVSKPDDLYIVEVR